MVLRGAARSVRRGQTSPGDFEMSIRCIRRRRAAAVRRSHGPPGRFRDASGL